MEQIEQLEHGFSIITRDDDIVIFRFSNLTTPALDLWLESLPVYSEQRNFQIRFVHDFSAVTLSLKKEHREKVQELDRRAPNVSGKAVILLKKGTFSRALQLFLNTGLVRTQPNLTTKIFFDLDEGIAWLNQ